MMIDPNSLATAYIRRLSDEGFWGSLTLKFESGKVVHLKKEENLKPEELSERPRLSNEQFKEATR